jgi:hypothetical protein
MKREARSLAAALGVAAAISLGRVHAQDTSQPALDLKRLAAFLVEAKQNGYASGDDSRIKTLDDRGSEVRFTDGDLVYRDRWYGGTSFTGQEIVWQQGRPVWSLNFYGANRPGTSAPNDELTKFHKRALRKVEASAPYRGPAELRAGDFVYLCEVTGSIEEFRGVERVLYRGTEVYGMEFHGGRTDR